MFHWSFYKTPPNSKCQKPIKKHKKDETITKECSFEHPQVQECSRVPRRTFNVPSILLQTSSKGCFRRRNWKNILNVILPMLNSLELLITFESTRWVIKLSKYIPQALWCSREYSTCHSFFYGPFQGVVLGIRTFGKNIYLLQGLLSSWVPLKALNKWTILL
jgi:hypothetical protein